MPESEAWENVVARETERTHSSAEAAADLVVERLKKDRPPAYAVVTDFESDVDSRMVGRKFISNNVVRIAGGYDKARTAEQLEWIAANYGKDAKKAGSRTFFTSDTHFGHANICRYCCRPWNSGKDGNGDLVVTPEDVVRMDEDLIARWNSAVGENDTVWHLGDFALGQNQKERIPELVSRLNGRINLVVGNHDHHGVGFYYSAGFHMVYDRPVVVNSFCILSHAPLEFVKAPFFNCFGHVHDCETYRTWSKDSCCVCVERHDYRPVPMELIERKWKELNAEGAI